MDPDSLYQWTLEFTGCGTIIAKSTGMTMFDTLSVRSDDPNGFSNTLADSPRKDNIIEGFVKEPSVHITAQSYAQNPNMTLYIRFLKQDCKPDNDNGDNVWSRTVEVSKGYYIYGPETLEPDLFYQITLQFSGNGNLTVTSTGMTTDDTISVRSDDANGFRQEVINPTKSENTIQGQVNGPSVHISAYSNPNNEKMTLYIKFNGSTANGFLLAAFVLICRLLA